MSGPHGALGPTGIGVAGEKPDRRAGGADAARAGEASARGDAVPPIPAPGPSRRRSFAVTLLAVGAVLFVAGCDPGPSGPGGVGAAVENPDGDIRAAVLELTGPNLYGVESRPGTRLFQAELPGGAGIRIVAISLGDLPPTFRVLLRDLGDPLPAFTLMELSDAGDQPVPSVAETRVRFFR